MSSNRAVCVLVDDSGRVGPLSYLVPDGMTLEPGMAVHVPFGRRELHGMVLGPALDNRATREVLGTYGRRCDPLDIDVADRLARRHFMTLLSVAGRLSPGSGRGAPPLDPGELRLVSAATTTGGDPSHLRRLLLASAGEDQCELAAAEAERIAGHGGGQVLVLCPTRSLVEGVLARFASGAVRLDAQAPAGAWSAFVAGAAPVGVGSRAASLYSAGRLGGIVVIEADHPGHREASQPYWDSVEVARERAVAHNCALTVISAAPTLRSLKGLKVALSGNWELPRVRVVDLSVLPPGQRHAPPTVLSASSRAHRNGHEVLAITSGNSERVCVRCRQPRPCEQCSDLGCVHQGGTCPVCTAIGVRWSGLGTPAARSRLGADRAVTVEQLVGLSQATRAVVVPFADTFLSSTSIDADAYAYRTLVRMARAAHDGELVLCTYEPDHPAIRALVSGDPTAMLQAAWEAARTLGLPPHRHLLTVRINAEKEPATKGHPGVLFGPRRRGREWELQLRFGPQDHDAVAAFVTKLRRRGKVRVALL